MKQLLNVTRNMQIAGSLEVADNFAARFKGLLGRKDLPDESGMLITKCNSVHMFFMRFAIDAIFVDENMRVIKIVPNFGPWRMASCSKARHTLELPAGAAAKHGIEVGDELRVVEHTFAAERALN